MVLRVYIGTLVSSLRRVKWRELEAEFGAGLDRARDLVEAQVALEPPPAEGEELSSPTLFSPTFPIETRDIILKLAALSPRLVVIEAWRDVEVAAGELVRRRSETGRQTPLPTEAFQRLIGAGVLAPLDYDVLMALRQLRNQAVHEERFEISIEEALEYAVMAHSVAARLRRLGEQLGDEDYDE